MRRFIGFTAVSLITLLVVLQGASADTFQFGYTGTVPVIADFDGDEVMDPALFHESSGNWYIMMSHDGSIVTKNWGFSGTIPVAWDYDRDGRDAVGVYHPSTGMWYLDEIRDTYGNNTNRGYYSFIGGGAQNEASGYQAFVGSGNDNEATGTDAGIVCGSVNKAAGYSSFVGGGYENHATNQYATIPGGYNNRAEGMYSFACGRGAKARHNGCFIFGDSQMTDFGTRSTAPDQVKFRCAGGVEFTDGSAHVSWMPGDMSWSFYSDRNVKENFEPVDRRDVLSRVMSIPVTRWNYIGYEKQHMGPMAQDFHEAFALGDGATTIDSGDLQGVTLAAVQGLCEALREKEARINKLERRLEALEQQVGR